MVHIGYGTQHRHTPGGLPIDRGKCYYCVKLSDKAGWNEMNRNKLEQLEKCTIRKVGEGIAQVFNSLSHPPVLDKRNQGMLSLGNGPTQYKGELQLKNVIGLMTALVLISWLGSAQATDEPYGHPADQRNSEEQRQMEEQMRLDRESIQRERAGMPPLQSERAMQLERDRWQHRDEDRQRQYGDNPYNDRGNFDGNPK